MQSLHFIRILQDLYERTYSAVRAGELTDAEESPIVESAILAADCCAENQWGDSERAGRIAAALLRARFGESAAQELGGLGAWARIAFAENAELSP